MKLTTGLEIGTMIYMIDAVEQNGRELWQCSTRGLVTVNGANSFSRVLCDKESFAPVAEPVATLDAGRSHGELQQRSRRHLDRRKRGRHLAQVASQRVGQRTRR